MTLQRLRHGARLALFVYLTATVGVMVSERVYWYYAGFNVESVVFLGCFYLLPAMAGIWTLALARGASARLVILAGAIYAFVAEGILTPIIYIDGPLPVMAAMFVGWHGILAFGVAWYGLRRLLLARRPRLLALSSLIGGGFWGLWAATASLADPPDPEDLAGSGADGALLDAGQFGLYALSVTATLAGAHWLLGWVWPAGWRPRTWTAVSLVVMCLAYGVLAYGAEAPLIIVPWAVIKLGALVALTLILVRRQERHRGPTVSAAPLDALAGRVEVRSLIPLALLPGAAVVVYQPGLRLPPDGAELIYWTLVALQVVLGAVVYLWAWRRTQGGFGFIRRRRPRPVLPA